MAASSHQAAPSEYVARMLRGYCHAAAFACALAAILGIFAISGVSLDALGYRYDVEGGFALEKIHPSTLLMIAGLGFKALGRPSLPGLTRVLFEDKELVLALAGVVLATAYIATALSVPITAPIDSYLMPILLCLLLKDMSWHGARLIAAALILFFVFNDLVALYEGATGSHLFFVIPPDVTGHPEAIGSQTFDWKGHLAWDKRATGLMGHPLDNALVTGTFVMVLQARSAAWLSAWLRAGLVALGVVAMVAFGGRVALVLVIVFSLGLWGLRFLRLILESRRLSIRGLAIACATVPVAVAGLAVLSDLNIFDRFVERFVADEGSAEARVLMWRLFDPIPWSDIVLGPDQDVVRMWQRLQGLELGIESFWAGMPLGYGLAVMAIVLTTWLLLFVYLARVSGRDAWLPIAYFMIVASTSAGLAGKTVTLGNLAALILVFMGSGRFAGKRRLQIPMPPSRDIRPSVQVTCDKLRSRLT